MQAERDFLQRPESELDLHTLNIVVHVGAGACALAVGLAQLAARKGGRRHRRLGRLYLVLFSVVMATAALGLFVFEFRAFLAVIALLAGYQAASGARAMQRRLSAVDALLAVAGLLAAATFATALQRVTLPWSPPVIYGTLGYLTVVAAYDLARFGFRTAWAARLWLYDHLAKMIGSLSALAAAFAGTVLQGLQPASQLLPSALGVGLIVFFWLRLSRSVAGDRGEA